mgnify:CR=1 FL=1
MVLEALCLPYEDVSHVMCVYGYLDTLDNRSDCEAHTITLSYKKTYKQVSDVRNPLQQGVLEQRDVDA